MEIADLLPDLQFARLGTDPSQIDFAFEAKRAAMEPHIIKRWTWYEALQREMHERNYSEKPSANRSMMGSLRTFAAQHAKVRTADKSGINLREF